MNRVIAAAGAVLTALAPATVAAAAHATTPRIVWQAKICRTDELWRTHDTLGQQVIIRNNTWGTARVCLQTAGRYSTAWRITSARGLRRAFIGAFPNEFYGCSWGKCSAGAILPRRMSRVRGISVTYATAPGMPAGTANKALDIWISVHKHVGGYVRGAEVMVWLDATYTPPYGRLPIVRVGGHLYFFGHHRACGPTMCWNYILFRRVYPTAAVRNLGLQPFFAYGEARGLIKQDWWLEGVDAGTEIGRIRRGMTIYQFSVRP